MVILLHPEIWVEYILNRNVLHQSDALQLLFNTLKNKNNKFLYTNDIREFYRSFFDNIKSDEYDYNDVFNHIFLDLEINNRLIVGDSGTIRSVDELVEYFKVNPKANLLYFCKASTLNTIMPIKGIGILDKINKPNKHWIYFSLSANNGNHKTKLEYFDFSSNNQIEELIFDLINFKNPSDRKIYIQSDYTNFGDIFNKIKEKEIKYCTCGRIRDRNKTTTELNSDKLKVKGFFRNASFVFSSDKKLTHPRTISHSNIVISMTHDFAEINIGNSNWELSFQYCCKSFSEKLKIITHYVSLS